jgi:hypothetical protein
MSHSLDIPASSSTVKVSLIDTKARIANIPTAVFLHPVIEVLPHLPSSPAWIFLIEHENGGDKQERYLFDLGIRKDVENLTEFTKQTVQALGFKIDVKTDARDVLEEHGVAAESINGVIWRYLSPSGDQEEMTLIFS